MNALTKIANSSGSGDTQTKSGNRPSRSMRGIYALGRMKTGAMNKTELAYSLYLDKLKGDGEILWWKFEGMKFRLADNSFYTPDFNVLRNNQDLEMHEVKGYWIGDARTKIKVAADLYPFAFIAIKAEAKKRGGGWVVEVIT